MHNLWGVATEEGGLNELQIVISDYFSGDEADVEGRQELLEDHDISEDSIYHSGR